ncbi:DUF3316 domain-containing protein [Psychromonas sp.]|uniref:DUF3316 domain-containing protein n=1 Tax=Psychromonas sp. TaxID=1884585 RepID=UPI003564E13F
MKQMMNVMKVLVVTSSILLFGTSAYAAKAIPGNYSHAIGNKTIEVPAVNTKEKAYALGFQELQALMKLNSGKKLNDELRLNLDTLKEQDSVTLESANVTVQEFMNEKGEIVYRGAVNVIYHYSYQIDSN